MTPVSDASPLISLARIGHFEIVIDGAGMPGAEQVSRAHWIEVRAGPEYLRSLAGDQGRAGIGVSIGNMGIVRIDLPSDLVSIARLNEGDISKGAARLIALELFHENKVSLGRAAELCQTPLAKFMEFAADHGISPLRYIDAELEEDRRTLAELGL